MPFEYDNAAGKSEASLAITGLKDWTRYGIEALSLWFQGSADNAAESMYVVLNDSVAVTHDNPNAAQIDAWTQWSIDLQAFADQGLNLSNINTITIGIGNRNNPVAGGSGMVFFDDIQLRQTDPEPVVP